MQDYISIGGSILSLIGVIIAIVQINKTLRASESAKNAAKQTEGYIKRNVILIDMASVSSVIDHLKELIRLQRFEASYIRVSDIISILIQMKSTTDRFPNMNKSDFTPSITQLSILRDKLEEKLNQSSTELNPMHINSKLSEISDDINRLIGKCKFITN